jgi:HEAT repeat protein
MSQLLLILVLAVPSSDQGKTIRELIADLDDFSTDRAATQALKEAGPKAFPALLEAFKPGESHSRDTIALILGEFAPEHPPAEQALLQALESKTEDPAVRSNCALGLGALANRDPGALKALLRALEDNDANVRVGVTESFRRMKERPKVALPLLLKGLKDGDCRVRTAAACSVAEMVEPKVAAPAILESLKGFQDAGTFAPQRGTLLFQTADALASMGAEVVPVLVKALSDDDEMVRQGAVVALGRGILKTTAVLEATPAVLKLLEDKKPDVRLYACTTLSMFATHFWTGSRRDRERAPEVVTALIRVLDDEDIEVHQEATRALRNMGRAAAGAVPRLIEDLKDKRAILRSDAAAALAHIGPAAKAAVPALIRALKDEDKSARLDAVAALGAIGPDAKEALPALSELLGEDEQVNRHVRFNIDRILGRPVPLPQFRVAPGNIWRGGL